MNIVLITTDHMRYDNIAANGNASMITPTLDKLCADGVTFENCITPSPVCQPARASLFTGRYPSVNGMRRNGIVLPEDEVTLPQVLAQKDYYCGHFGKLHFIPHKKRNHRAYHPLYGFHEMKMSDEPGCYDDEYGQWLRMTAPHVREACGKSMPGLSRTPLEMYPFAGTHEETHGWWTASESIRFIEENKERPFFCNVGFYNPHPPLMPPADMLKLYEGRDLKPRTWQEGELDTMPGLYKNAHDNNYSKMREEEWTEYRRYFYAMVSDVDRNVQRIINSLETAGIMDNTLIVFTSDHGDYLGDHGLANKGHMCYRQVINVPLVISGPGIPKGKTIDSIVELTDLMPTLVKAADAEMPYGVQGIDIAPVISGDHPGREFGYCEYYCTEDVRMLAGKKVTYSIHSTGEEVLIDLKTDPNEQQNQAGNPEYAELLNTMRHKMNLKAMQIIDPKPERFDMY